MNSTPGDEDLPPSLKLLKWLVIVLTATMILGVITIVAVFVTRMPDGNAPIALPERLALPEGVRPAAVTMGRDFIAVVTDDRRILIYDRDGGLRQEVEIDAPATTGAPNIAPPSATGTP